MTRPDTVRLRQPLIPAYWQSTVAPDGLVSSGMPPMTPKSDVPHGRYTPTETNRARVAESPRVLFLLPGGSAWSLQYVRETVLTGLS